MAYRRKVKQLLRLFRDTFKGWLDDDPFRQSAVVSYYAIFSLPALLVLVINLAGIFFTRKSVHGEINRQIESAMGSETAEQIAKFVEKAGDTEGGFITSAIAIGTIIFGSLGVFVQMQKTLNIIWGVKEKEDAGFLKLLRNRLFSFGLVISIGFLLLISMVVSSALAALSHYLESILPDIVAYVFYMIEFLVSISVISVFFALMFKYLPDIKVAWRNIWRGAFLTGALFMIGKYALSLYFGKAEPASIYGASGSVILILLWGSYSSMIVFFGAEFTKQYTLLREHRIKPSNIAYNVERDQNGKPDDEKEPVDANNKANAGR